MNNNHELLADSLAEKINEEFPNNNIISKNFMNNIFGKIDLNDKTKIKNLYHKIIEKLKLYNKNNILNNPNTNLNKDENINKILRKSHCPIKIPNHLLIKT